MDELSQTICFFNSHKSWGGGEKWHNEVASHLQKRGYSVWLAADRRGALYRRAQSLGLRVCGVRISNLSFLNPFKLVRLYRLFRSNAVRAVILNLPSDLKTAGVAARLAGVKTIVYRRGSAIPIKDSFLNRLLFRYVLSDVVANSEETKRTILENNPALFPESRIHVIYNGIDLENYDNHPVRSLIQRTSGELILGHAGRLSRQKNQRFLIDVAKALKGRGLHFKLLIAGQGELEGELKQYALEQGVAEEVVFLGFVKDIRSFMSSIDVFLLSSLWEGFGYVLIEAMAAHKPVVAFNSSSTPEIVENGHTGFLTEPNNLDDFTEKIAVLTRKGTREAFGANGRRRVERCFEFKKNLEKLQILLDASQ